MSPLLGLELEQRRIPGKQDQRVSDVAGLVRESIELIPKIDCQQAFEPATRTAFQSCSWIWPRCRSIVDSSCGGR